MKKSTLLIIILAILAGITFYLFNHKNILNSNADISVSDVSKINKLLIVDMQGNKAVLVKNKEKWILNDSLVGRVDAVQNILNVLQNVQATQPVPNAAHNTIINQLSTLGTKVEAYDANNNVLTSFTIGGPTEKADGNYGYKKNADRPYIYHLKLYQGDFSASFFTSPNEWRDREIINYKPDSIATIAVYYSNDKDSSFHIQNKNNELLATYDNGKTLNCSHTKVKEYLKEFESKYCMNYETKLNNIDSVKYKGLSYGYIAVETKNGKLDTLHLVRFKANQRANIVKKINGIYYDQEYLFAYNKKDLMVIPTQTFAKILSVPSYFGQ